MLIFKLATRNVFRNRLRSLIAILSIAVGITGISFSESFMADSLYQLRENNINSGIGHFQVFKPKFDTDVFKDPAKFLFEPNAQLENDLRQKGAVAIAPRLKFAAMITAHDRDYSIFAEAGIPSRETQLTKFFRIIDGSNLKDEDKFKLLVGEGVAKAQRIKAGDMVSLYGRTYSGSVNILDFEVAGVFRSISELYDERGVVLRLEDAQVFMDTNKIHNIIGLLQKTELTEDYVKTVQPAAQVQQLEVKPWTALADFYIKTAALFDIQLFILELVIFFMIFLVLNQSLTTAFFERLREFGVMKALGDQSSHLARVMLTEVFILNFFGAVLGAVVTYFVFNAINVKGITMPPPPNIVMGWTVHLHLSVALYLKALLVTVLSTFLASAFPIFKITRMPVIKGIVEDH